MAGRTLLALFGLIALAALTVGVPYYTGHVAEQSFHAGLATLADHPQLEARPGGYDRGWFGAEAQSELTLRVDGHGPVTFPARHTIRHGWISSDIDTVIEVPEGASEPVRSAFDQAVLTAHTTVSLKGDQHTDLHAPAATIEAAPGRLEWDGATGTVEQAGKRLLLDIQMPRVRLTDGETQVTLEGGTLTGDLHRDAPALWLGDSRFELDRLEADVPDLDRGGRLAFRVHELDLRQAHEADGPDLFAFDLVMRAAEIDIGGEQTWRDLVWETELRNIDRTAYLDLLRELPAAAEKADDPDELNERVSELIAAAAPDFLARSPSIRIPRFEVSGPDGPLTGAMDLRFDGDGSYELTYSEVIARLAMQARARVPQVLVERVLTETATASARAFAGQHPAVDDEEVATLAEMIMQNQIREARAAGLLKADGDSYVFEASFRHGSPVINGVPVDELL